MARADTDSGRTFRTLEKLGCSRLVRQQTDSSRGELRRGSLNHREELPRSNGRHLLDARNIAKGFDLTGWIRNLIDGRVEMQVSGEEDEVRAFLKAVMESELRAHIRKQNETQLDTLVEARGFEIRS